MESQINCHDDYDNNTVTPMVEDDDDDGDGLSDVNESGTGIYNGHPITEQTH